MAREKVLDREAARAFRLACRREGKHVVFTNGCYDLLHPGHLSLLEQAASLGDALIVGINSDASVRRLKGPSRPVVPDHERAEVLAALRVVAAVTVFGEDTPAELIEAILPDLLVKGTDWGEGEIIGRDTVESHGGKVVRLPLLPGFSTTSLLAAIGGPGTPSPR